MLELKSVAFCVPTRIATDVFQFMSLKPTTPNGVTELELLTESDNIPFPCVVVTFRNDEYVIPMTNVSSFQLRDDVAIDESTVREPKSPFCTCGEEHYNFEKICKSCTRPIKRGDVDVSEEDGPEVAGDAPIDGGETGGHPVGAELGGDDAAGDAGDAGDVRI